jgi:hypothetical protein
MENEKSQEGFTDLSEFRKVGLPGSRAQTNVIKGMQIVLRGTEEVHRADHDPDQPDVLVHREGETIVSIDFVCSCGRSTSLRFQYDGE